jgi:hypothetical protein
MTRNQNLKSSSEYAAQWGSELRIRVNSGTGLGLRSGVGTAVIKDATCRKLIQASRLEMKESIHNCIPSDSEELATWLPCDTKLGSEAGSWISVAGSGALTSDLYKPKHDVTASNIAQPKPVTKSRYHAKPLPKTPTNDTARIDLKRSSSSMAAFSSGNNNHFYCVNKPVPPTPTNSSTKPITEFPRKDANSTAKTRLVPPKKNLDKPVINNLDSSSSKLLSLFSNSDSSLLYCSAHAEILFSYSPSSTGNDKTLWDPHVWVNKALPDPCSGHGKELRSPPYPGGTLRTFFENSSELQEAGARVYSESQIHRDRADFNAFNEEVRVPRRAVKLSTRRAVNIPHLELIPNVSLK